VSNEIYVVDLDREIKDLQTLSAGDWNFLYKRDRQYGDEGVRVEDRGIRCAGICWNQGVVAWMYLRQQRNGRREAVHQHREDQDRHRSPARGDRHIAWQERAVRAAESDGHSARTEVRATGPRGRIQTDVLYGEGEHRIGLEIQLSDTPTLGKSSVPYRVAKAHDLGITPWWHTDRVDYAQRTDATWTRSDNLPAQAIVAKGEITVWTGHRTLDFWRCDDRSPVPCPTKKRGRCGDFHTTPQVQPIGFDDLIRKTAAGLIVPLEYASGGRTHRFWVAADDRDRYLDNGGEPGAGVEDSAGSSQQQPKASKGGPTCRPRIEARPVACCPGCKWPLLLPDGEPCPECWRCDGTAEEPVAELPVEQIDVEDVPARYAAYDIAAELRCTCCGRPCSTTNRAGAPLCWGRHRDGRRRGRAA
jgi:hypothetical protein